MPRSFNSPAVRGCRLLTCFAAAVFAVGCADPNPANEPAPRPGGKADTAGIPEGSASALGVLRVVNELDADALIDEVGLPENASNNIAAYRLGDDGVPGTADDREFENLAQLDDIPYVNAAVFEKLLAFAVAQGYVPAPVIPDYILDTPLVFQNSCRTEWWYDQWVYNPPCDWTTDCYCALISKGKRLEVSVPVVVSRSTGSYRATLHTPELHDPNPGSPNPILDHVPVFSSAEVVIDGHTGISIPPKVWLPEGWYASELSFRFYGATLRLWIEGVDEKPEDSHGCDPSLRWLIDCELHP